MIGAHSCVTFHSITVDMLGLNRNELNMTVLKRFYIWNGEYNMGYCLQSKTGTTTWMVHWLKLSHLPKVSIAHLNGKKLGI